MRRAWVPLFAAAAVLYVLARRAYWVGYFNDDAFYLIGARSILAGRFVELSNPAQPPLLQYLPGYPLLLAPALALSGGSWLACQLESALFMLASAAAAVWALGEELDEGGRLMLAALCLLNPLALSLSGAVLSDAPFTLALLLVVGAARRRWERRDARQWLLLGAAAGAMFYLRAVGLAAPLGLAAALLWERRPREAGAALSAAGLVVAPWLARNWLLRGAALVYAGELARPFAASPLREAAGAAAALARFYLPRLYGTTLVRWPYAASSEAAGAALAAAALAGAAACRGSGRPGRHAAAAVFCAYMAAVAAWPKASTRYLLPAVPFAAAWGLEALAALERRLGWRGLRAAAAAAALASYAPPALAILRASARRDAPPARPPERTFAWIRAHTPAQAVFACELDGQLWLRTGRRALTLPRVGGAVRDPGGWAAAAGVDYVLLEPTGDMLRTRRGRSPDDAVPQDVRRGSLEAAAALRRVFADPAEGTAIYAVLRKQKAPGLAAGGP